VAPCTPAAARWVLAATIIASSMVFIDSTVVNVALPALQRELNASLADVQWVVESYALFLAALLLVGGAAGDRFGRRRMFVFGVLVFAVASIGCGIAGNVRELIVARSVQGIGGALLVPGSLAIISASFDEGVRGKAIGTWSGATAITAAVGPVLGGWLIDHLSWRSAFFINVPLAAAVLFLTTRHVPESRNPDAQGALDWPGASLVTLGLGGLVYGLIEASVKGWPHAVVVAPIALGIAALAGFVAVEMRQPAPMLPLQLFRSRAFAGANVLTLLLYAALAGTFFFIPLNLIQVQGYSTTAAGAALLPLIVLMSVLSRWSGGLVDRYGARPPLVIGPGVAALGFALLAIPSTGGSYWTTFFAPMVVLGLGMSITVAPLTTTVMSSVDTRFAGAASGINNAASRVAGLLAIALFGLVMAPVFERDVRSRLQRDGASPAIVEAVERQHDKLAAIELPEGIGAHDKAIAKDAIAASFVTGFRWIMIVSAVLSLAGALSAWLMIGKADKREPRN
jgi:EmrB/QacA subfamily drug resistance transporter